MTLPVRSAREGGVIRQIAAPRLEREQENIGSHGLPGRIQAKTVKNQHWVRKSERNSQIPRG